MKNYWLISLGFLVAMSAGFWSTGLQITEPATGAPPYGEAWEDVPDVDPWGWLRNWQRPEGSPRVGLQVGHWQSAEAPEELKRLRENTGSSGGGKSEAEVNYEIAKVTKVLLEARGIGVDLIPATVSPAYWADVFVAIHADGSTDRQVSGYKVAAPWRDLTSKSNRLVQLIEESYANETKLPKDPNITRNMRGYYAFSWWRYEHAVHPMTTSAILETGFLTNLSDQKLLINKPGIPAAGLAAGIINYLEQEGLLAKLKNDGGIQTE